MVASFTQRPSGTEIAKHAWNSTVSAARAMPALFLGALFVGIILSLALTYSSLRHLAGPGHFPSLQGLAVMIASILAWSALTAPLAVAMHRFVLLGQITGSVLSFAPRHTKLFFLWAVALQLVFDAVQGIGGFLTSHPFGLTRIVATIVVVVVSVHLAMIFPAVAIEDGANDWQARIAKSWRQMQGNAWLLIRAGIVAFLPVIVLWVIVAIVMVLFGVMARGIVGPVGSFSLLPRLWLSAALAVITVLSIALGAALASWTYAWTRSSGQAQSAQTATSTVT
jgi:hypothetical protein